MNEQELAASPETDPGILRQLSKSPDFNIRKIVASNPNTPLDVIWELIIIFPHDVVDNPVFALIVLSEPNWIEKIRVPYLLRLLSGNDIPDIFVKQALQHSDDRVRSTAIKIEVNNPQASTTRLEQLLSMPDCTQEWKINLAKSETTIWRVLDKIMSDFEHDNLESWQVRFCQAVARHPSTPPHILENFTNSEHQVIRFCLALRNNFSEELLVKLIVDPYPEVRRQLLEKHQIPINLITRLENHHYLFAREFAAEYLSQDKLIE